MMLCGAFSGCGGGGWAMGRVGGGVCCLQASPLFGGCTCPNTLTSLALPPVCLQDQCGSHGPERRH